MRGCADYGVFTSTRAPLARQSASPTGRPVPGLPTWPLNPQPLTPVSAQASEDDGTPWLTVGLIAGAVLALAGTAATAGRVRPPEPPRRRPGVAPVAAGSPYAATRYSCEIRASLLRTNRAADSKPRRFGAEQGMCVPMLAAEANRGRLRLRILLRMVAEVDRRSRSLRGNVIGRLPTGLVPDTGA